MIIIRSIKRITCIFLCLILISNFTTQKHQSDAFAFLLTPVISKVLIAGAVACGVRLASDADAQKFAQGIWNGMSDTLKELITIQSEFSQVAQTGFMLWGSNAWSDFTGFLSSFLDINGGAVRYFTTSSGNVDLDLKLSFERTTFDFTYIKGDGSNSYVDQLSAKLKTIPGYSNFVINTGWGGYFSGNRFSLMVGESRFDLASCPSYYETGTYKITLPYLQYYNNNGSNTLRMLPTGSGSLILRNLFITIPQDENFNKLVSAYDNSIILSRDLPKSLFVDQAIEQFFTGGVVSEGEVEYVIDVPYFPTAENSICPTVPPGSVITVPVPDVYNPGAVVGKVGTQDIPADFPLNPGTVAPPIAPPINPDAGFLQRILDWLSQIWSKIASIPGAILSGITGIFVKAFDVTQFKLDFTPLKNAGIQNKFPFCIPFDLYNVLKTVLKPGEADFRIKLDTIYFKIDYMLPINEPIFQLVRNFFRWSALFGFIISLIRGTKNLIKW